MNLPNKLTILRILLVPVIVLIWIFPYAQFGIDLGFIQFGYVKLPILNIITLVLFSFASFTDFLDGYIARSKHLVTTFGKFADPIADKLLVNTMLIIFASSNLLPVVPVVLMLGRDTIVDGCRMIASKNGVVVAAGYLGKVKTVAQMITIIFVLLFNLPFELYGIPFTDIILWFATFVSIASGTSYFMQLKEYIFESM
jgi:CDP-diacylglycerol--glycerol-3-phosphate 3-phosphatidyltransferase